MRLSRSFVKGPNRLQRLQRDFAFCTQALFCFLSPRSPLQGLLPEEGHGFNPSRETPDKWFGVRQLEAIESQREVPLYICFVDLPNVYDSADRELLSEVLTRSVVAIKKLAIIRSANEGMRTRVRTNDDERLKVTERLRQGCELSPLLFEMVFAPPFWTSYWYASANTKPS